MFRVQPAMGPEMYKTYAIQAPRSTHQRKATCAEVECDAWRLGWTSSVDESTDLGMRQAAYIRNLSGRRFIEERTGEMTVFTFYPEQRCFAEHLVPLDREPQFLVLGGDWRGNPRGEEARIHRTFDDWANDFGEHQDRLKKAQS